jgi:hypothetical protein
LPADPSERLEPPVVMMSLRFGRRSMSSFFIGMRSRMSTTTSKGARVLAASSTVAMFLWKAVMRTSWPRLAQSPSFRATLW